MITPNWKETEPTGEPKVFLINILRNQLDSVHSRDYLVWFYKNEKKEGEHRHHLLESRMGSTKLNDMLLVSLDPETHQRIHYGKGYEKNEFERYFCRALNSLFKYIQEKKGEGAKPLY